MKNLKWHSKLTTKFVRLYLSKECLWNPRHPEYKNVNAKCIAHNELVLAMKKYVDIDIVGVRTKIKNLRCTYIQEVSKVIKRSKGPDNIYQSTLPWFKEMDRCLKNVMRLKSVKPDNYFPKNWTEKESYVEEHLDEELLDDTKEVGEVSTKEEEEEHRNNQDADSDDSESIQIDGFTARWGGDVTLRFVKCYLSHECLWNTKKKEYTNKAKKLQAIKEIIKEMNKYVKLDVNAVRTKIRNLRSTYNQELLKIVRKSTDPNNIYVPSMPWFKLMDEKLKDLVQLKSRYIRTDWDTPWSDNSDQNTSSIVDKEVLQNIKVDIDSLGDVDHINHDDMDHNDIGAADTTDAACPLFITPQDAKESFFEDEYDIFGKYIGAQLRKLDLKSALQAKADILNILSKARLNQV